jgi:hypothetical protein
LLGFYVSQTQWGKAMSNQTDKSDNNEALKHKPDLPWRYDGVNIVDSKGKIVVNDYSDSTNFPFIVAAVNSFGKSCPDNE